LEGVFEIAEDPAGMPEEAGVREAEAGAEFEGERVGARVLEGDGLAAV